MQDIADRLHVSRSTVSLVLSGKAGSKVSAAVQKDVIRTAQALNYHVNGLARSLRTGESQLISVIVTDISNEFFGRLTFRIQEEAKKAGYLVLTINSNESAREFDEMAGMLISKQVDGIIAVPPPGGEATLERIKARGVPLVTIDRLCEGLDANYVGVDNYQSSLDAVRGLIEDGCTSISMVGLDLDIPPLNDRRRAYEDALAAAGLGESTDVRLIPFADLKEEDFARILNGIAEAQAVFFTSRRAFTQVMAYAAGHLVSPSPDQHLLCFDDISSYSNMPCDIRYIDQPVDGMARKAFELLIGQIKGSPSPGKYLFRAPCITRNSNG